MLNEQGQYTVSEKTIPVDTPTETGDSKVLVSVP